MEGRGTDRACEGEQLVRCWVLWVLWVECCALGGLLKFLLALILWGATLGTNTDYLLGDLP